MRRIKLIVVTATLALGAMMGWRVGACEVENLQLQEDLHDLAAQMGPRVGYVSVRSDDDFRDAVIHKAKDHDIDLDPNQVTVQRNGSGLNTTMYLAADYSVAVNLPGYRFSLHFTPSSTKQAF